MSVSACVLVRACACVCNVWVCVSVCILQTYLKADLELLYLIYFSITKYRHKHI